MKFLSFWFSNSTESGLSNLFLARDILALDRSLHQNSSNIWAALAWSLEVLITRINHPITYSINLLIPTFQNRIPLALILMDETATLHHFPSFQLNLTKPDNRCFLKIITSLIFFSLKTYTLKKKETKHVMMCKNITRIINNPQERYKIETLKESGGILSSVIPGIIID